MTISSFFVTSRFRRFGFLKLPAALLWVGMVGFLVCGSASLAYGTGLKLSVTPIPGVFLVGGEEIKLAHVFVPAALHTDSLAITKQIIDATDISTAQVVKAARSATDRYGRPFADVILGETSLTIRLIKAGALLPYFEPETPDSYIQAMQAARKTQSGLWRTPFLDPIPATAAEARIGNFAIVIGKVVSVGERRTRIYLNFGRNWNTDFTVVGTRPGVDNWLVDGVPLRDVTDRCVEVFAFLSDNRGPYAALQNNNQINILPDQACKQP